MFVDLTGKTRIKLGLHTSTTRSIGNEKPVDVAKKYLDRGYDAIALTDNWLYNDDCEIEGLKIISGCEYSTGSLEDGFDAYHIVGIGMTSDPNVPPAWQNMKKTAQSKACEIVNMIQKANGFAFVAYPAHNGNIADKLLELGEFDGFEIYNSETQYKDAESGYAGDIADKLALYGKNMVLLASDGVNCYKGEEYRCALMVEATDMETSHIVRALRQGRYYSTEGPELHVERIGADKIRVKCSPVSKIEFFTDNQNGVGKVIKGENLLEADLCVKDGERFVRVEVMDENGLMAWSNIVRFDELYR